MGLSLRQLLLIKPRVKASATMRLTTLAVSLLLHVGFLLALFITPLKMVKPYEAAPQSHNLIAAIASPDDSEWSGKLAKQDKKARQGTKRQQKAPKSQPKALSKALSKSRDAPKSAQKPQPALTVFPAPALQIAPVPKPQHPSLQSPLGPSVYELVEKLIGGASPSEPVDFTLQDGSVVAGEPVSEALVLAAMAAQTGQGDSQDCPTIETIQAALQGDEAFKEALMKLPRSDRSVANVIMGWDGRWIDAVSRSGTDARLTEPSTFTSMLRARIQATIGNIPIHCRNAPMYGPAFILIADDTEPTILAFGSGEWQWADLLASEETTAPILRASTLPLAKF